MINIINMPLAAKGPGLPCVVVPKSNSQEFHSILKLYCSWNVENMPVFMFHYLLTWLGPEPLLSAKVDEYLFTVHKEPLHRQNGDVSESSDDSSEILCMLIVYNIMWSFHLARLPLSLFSQTTLLKTELCDTNAGVSQRPFRFCTGGFTKKMYSQSGPAWRKHVYHIEAPVPRPGLQTDPHKTDCVAKQHTYQ